MTGKAPPRRPPLPDIDDDVLKERLQPLADRVLPPPPTRAGAGAPRDAGRGRGAGGDTGAAPGGGAGGVPRPSGVPEHRNAEGPENDAGRPAEAAFLEMERTRDARGPKKGVEFLLPARVVAALRAAAARDGVSMSLKLLEALRDAGYPVIGEDFVDLRKLPRR